MPMYRTHRSALSAFTQYGPAHYGITLPLNIYSHLKNWCERAKDRNFLKNGASKSTLKRRPYIVMGGTLVGE